MDYVLSNLGVCWRFLWARSDEFLTMDNSPMGLFWIVAIRLLIGIPGVALMSYLIQFVPSDTPERQSLHDAFSGGLPYIGMAVSVILYLAYMRLVVVVLGSEDRFYELMVADMWFAFLAAIIVFPWMLIQLILTILLGYNIISYFGTDIPIALFLIAVPYYGSILFWLYRYFRLYCTTLETSLWRTALIFALSFVPHLLAKYFAPYLLGIA